MKISYVITSIDYVHEILDIQNKCKYIPPQFIFKEWTKQKNSETVNELKFEQQVKHIKSGKNVKQYGTFPSNTSVNNGEAIAITVEDTSISKSTV